MFFYFVTLKFQQIIYRYVNVVIFYALSHQFCILPVENRIVLKLMQGGEPLVLILLVLMMSSLNCAGAVIFGGIESWVFFFCPYLCKVFLFSL